MEEILRGKEADKVSEEIEELLINTFDFNSNVVFFPIRHHSPACSYHLKKTIKEYKPDIILIEGPIDANGVKEFLCDEESIMPVAIYYSYSDSKGFISEEKKQYKCYYPFLDASPELVALREGKNNNIKTKFIDLPYSEILINSKEGQGLLKNAEKSSYNDDYLIAENKFINTLCEKQGCRNFSELWEKVFEIQGIYIESREFIKNILSYCYISRLYSSEETLKNEACIAREIFMAQNIQAEMNKHNKVLVVSGGFHTYGIYKLLKSENQLKMHKIREEDKGVYLMIYSMEACDALNGYNSGMVFPNFYNEVYSNIEEKVKNPYESAVLKNLILCGKEVRKNNGCLSTFDEICALNMAKGLAGLRNKKESGVYELIDAVTSSYIKGDLNVSTEEPLKILYKNIRGNTIGQLSEKADVPPIIKDFKVNADKYNLKITTTLEQNVSLEMYSKEKHRQISYLLHRMNFLDTGFCKLVKGPNILLKKNLNIVRETWKYKYNTKVNAALIDSSVYGATLEEAVKTIAEKQIKENAQRCGDIAKILVQCLNMGLFDMFNENISHLNKVIAEDGSFFSLKDCLYYIKYVYEVKILYNLESLDVVRNLITCIYNKICILIPDLKNIKEDEERKAIDALKEVYNITLNRELTLDGEMLSEALKSLLNMVNNNSSIEGAVLGIMYALGEESIEHIKSVVKGYLLGTKDIIKSIPQFLTGLFCTCKDLMFIDNCIIEAIDCLVNTLEAEEFIKVIPQLRLSFSYFTPKEIDEIGFKVSKLYNISKDELQSKKAVNPEIIALGLKINEYAIDIMSREHIL